jgi:hypothetical protein
MFDSILLQTDGRYEGPEFDLDTRNSQIDTFANQGKVDEKRFIKSGFRKSEIIYQQDLQEKEHYTV